MQLSEIIKNIIVSKTCSIKPDADSAESKTVTLKVKFHDVPLQAVFDKAVSQTVIQWQNGPGRSKWNLWKNHQVIDVNFKAPATTTIDPEQAMIAMLKNMTPEQAAAKLSELAAQITTDEKAE